MYRHFIKRVLDIVLSVMALVVLLPVLIVVAVLVRVKLGSPILFVQERPGKNCKIFKLKKFRTMSNKKDENGELLPDEQRLTKFGKVLRALSIDELPELINIIAGDMSIVGPRPLLCSYLPYYTKEENRRHDVLPGLTGLAQINGRNAADWDIRLGYDVEYVDNVSFILDVKIVLMTVVKVVKRDGVKMGEQRTVEKFDIMREEERHGDISV